MKRLAANLTTPFKIANYGFYQISRTVTSKYSNEQTENIHTMLSHDIIDWTTVRSKVLQTQGSINEKNFDSVLMKIILTRNEIEKALSFAEYVISLSTDLNIGSIKSLLQAYYEAGKKNKLKHDDEQFILDTYTKLSKKYKILDYSTNEALLHALCVINEWEVCLKLIDDIKLTAVPTHSAFSTLIATLFNNDQVTEARKVIKDSIINKRPLKENAYNGWINYIRRNYKTQETVLKHLDNICQHVADNFEILDEGSAKTISDAYVSLGWVSKYSTVKKQSGTCVKCRKQLQCLKLSNSEFALLKSNVESKLIVGSDLFLKTSPQELDRFLAFVKRTAPYDIVLDALNIAFASSKDNVSKVDFLADAVRHFKQKNKKILLLGRNHMLSWSKRKMQYISSNTCSFFIDNLSQDDPFFITAAILSGPHTDIVSKDLFRGHRMKMPDDTTRLLFRRWQWQHQWMIFMTANGPKYQEPLTFSPCAQRVDGCWHLPFEKSFEVTDGVVSDGVPRSWICLHPPANTNK